MQRAGTWPVAVTVPGVPRDLAVVAGDGQVSVSWVSPASNGGSPITDYVVQFLSDASQFWTTFADGTSTSVDAVVTGLTNGVSHRFRVAAVNAIGTGEYTEQSAAVTPATVSTLTIPVMTSQSTPSGQVLAGGNWINALAQSVSADSNAWRIFSRSGEVYSSPGSTSQTIPIMEPSSFAGYDWGSSNRINGYVAYPSDRFTSHFASSINFQGSNDGTAWVTLDSRSFLSSDWDNDGPVKQTISLGSQVTYRMVRWVVGSRTEFARLQVTIA
jgi:hypothetical protein